MTEYVIDEKIYGILKRIRGDNVLLQSAYMEYLDKATSLFTVFKSQYLADRGVSEDRIEKYLEKEADYIEEYGKGIEEIAQQSQSKSTDLSANSELGNFLDARGEYPNFFEAETGFDDIRRIIETDEFDKYISKNINIYNKSLYDEAKLTPQEINELNQYIDELEKAKNEAVEEMEKLLGQLKQELAEEEGGQNSMQSGKVEGSSTQESNENIQQQEQPTSHIPQQESVVQQQAQPQYQQQPVQATQQGQQHVQQSPGGTQSNYPRAFANQEQSQSIEQQPQQNIEQHQQDMGQSQLQQIQSQQGDLPQPQQKISGPGLSQSEAMQQAGGMGQGTEKQGSQPQQEVGPGATDEPSPGQQNYSPPVKPVDSYP